MSRLVSNSQVKEFYTNSKKNASTHVDSAASGGTADPSHKLHDKDPPSKPATALSNEGDDADKKSSEASIRVTSATEGQQKELESSTTRVSASTGYVKTVKMIPRKQFKAIKKKLQKREPIAVFSIPELADHIGLYLRSTQRQKLCLVSKALYAAFPPTLHISMSSSFKPSSKPPLNSTEVQALVSRVRSLSLNIHNDQTNQIQIGLLNTVYKHFATLETLNIEYQGEKVTVLKEVLVNLPGIRNLSLTFMAGVKAKVVMQTLIGVRNTTSYGNESVRLQSLEIILGDADRDRYVAWSDFKQLLRSYPDLKSLSLLGLSFWKQLRGPPTSDDDDDNDDDYEEVHVEMDIEDGKLSQRPRRLRQYSKMERLKFTRCTLAEDRLLGMDKLFPRLQTLEIIGCSGTWQDVLERPLPTPWRRPSAATTPLDNPPQIKYSFPELRSLIIWLVYQSGRAELVNLVRGRPHLSTLETDLLPLRRGGLLGLAEYSSAPPPTEPTAKVASAEPEKGGDAAGGPVIAAPVLNRFKRLALQTYSSPSLTTEVLDQFYGSACFRELEYIFMQCRVLTMKRFPFAKTLRSLYLGGEEKNLSHHEEATLKNILHQLPVLEVLRIDRYIDSYRLFSGLGREHESTLLDTDQADLTASSGTSNFQDWAWINEPPFLYDLEFYVRLPLESAEDTSELTKSDGHTMSLETLQRQVLDRFRFLERLKLHMNGLNGRLELPAIDELEAWKKKVQEDRGGEGSRLPFIEFATR
ncbi:hypothetical protein BGX26_002310 [Mortierella sp. AD094]|nr:hypothetical protein BGX26_002310 [Mortierella sp. AD094]